MGYVETATEYVGCVVVANVSVCGLQGTSKRLSM